AKAMAPQDFSAIPARCPDARRGYPRLLRSYRRSTQKWSVSGFRVTQVERCPAFFFRSPVWTPLVNTFVLGRSLAEPNGDIPRVGRGRRKSRGKGEKGGRSAEGKKGDVDVAQRGKRGT